MTNTKQDVFKYVNMLTGVMHDALGSRCWPYIGGLNSKGRPYFRVAGVSVLAYRLVWELVNGPIEDGGKYLHQCDNPICCNPAHAKIGTHQENMNEMKERARHGLPHHTVRAIRKLATVGRTHQEIAELYGLGRSTVTEIINGDNYKEVT